MENESVLLLKVGDHALRRNSSDKQPEWVRFVVNETYLPLISQFPQDYMVTPELERRNRVRRLLVDYLEYRETGQNVLYTICAITGQDISVVRDIIRTVVDREMTIDGAMTDLVGDSSSLSGDFYDFVVKAIDDSGKQIYSSGGKYDVFGEFDPNTSLAKIMLSVRAMQGAFKNCKVVVDYMEHGKKQVITFEKPNY